MAHGGGGRAKVTPNLAIDEEGTRMLNLTVLQRLDPAVEDILITAAHVTLYDFDTDLNQWSRKDVEGSLFVVKRFVPVPNAGYDDIPKEIPDPDAKKPEDWDDEEDGEWTAPTIPNPEYKGPWKQKKIKNPNYQGKWKAPMIDNPDFKDDPYIYAFDSLKYIGIELWQVKSGTLFDNILITDDPELAKTFAEETWGKHKDAEKAAFDEAEKKKEEEEAGKVDEDDDDLDDEDAEDDDKADDDKAESDAEDGKDSDDEKHDEL